MPEELNNDQDYEEEWLVVLNNKSEYSLSKNQALIVKQAIAQGDRGIIIFETFTISIPYIVEFYRVKRFLKNAKQLPIRATEEEHKPLSPEKWEALKKDLYKNFSFLKGKQAKESNGK